MNQRYRNESHGGYHGDKMRDRDERYARDAGSRDWDQRDLGTRGGEYASFGSYGDRGFGQGAGGRDFRETEYGGQQYGGEEYGWATQSYDRGEYTGSLGGDNRFSAEGYGGPGGYRPEGAQNQRNFAGGGRGDMNRQSPYYGSRQFGEQFGTREYVGSNRTGMGDPYGMGREAGAGQYGGQYRSGQYESAGQFGGGYGSQYGAYGNPGADIGRGAPYGTPYGSQYGGSQVGGQYGGQGFGMGRGDAGMYGSPRTGQYGRPGAGMDRTQAGRGARGLGPKGYRRSDERLQEDICERLTDDWRIDASDVSVRVSDGIVTLEGSVPERRVKHRIEDLVEACSGVTDIRNNLTVSSRPYGSSYGTQASDDTSSMSRTPSSPASASSRSGTGGGIAAGGTTGSTSGSSGRSGSTGSTGSGATDGKH